MKVSVIICNYNYARYLADAVASVLAQTYQNFEIIIVDDGSTDNSHQILANFKAQLPSEKLKVIFQENQGHGGAINTGFQNSVGDIIAILDSDDVWMPTKLEKVIRAFDRSDVVGVIHPLNYMDGEGKITIPNEKHFKIPNGDLAQVILQTGAAWHFTSSPTYRRNILHKILPMDPPEWRFWPDGCLLYCAAFLGKIIPINEALGNYRIHGANTFFSTEKSDAHIAKTLAGVEVTNHWINQFLERIAYPERVDLRSNLDYRRLKFYLDKKWKWSEVIEISQLILGWHFYTWYEKNNYLIRLWVKSLGFIVRRNIILEETSS